MPKPDLNKDYYGILELKQDAGPEEIKKAYYKLAFKWHPDRNHGKEQDAATKFQDVSSAHEILIDPAVRAKYDADRAKLLARKQPTPLTSPNNPYNPYANFPSTRPSNPRPEASPNPAGGNQYAQYTTQTNAPWTNPANPRSRTQAQDKWKAWDSMRNGGSASGRGQPPPPPPFMQSQGPQQPRRPEQAAKSYPPKPTSAGPTPKTRAGWTESEDQRNGQPPPVQRTSTFGPGLARANTMRSPRPSGFAPGAPASGDEPSARNVSAYHHVRADSSRGPARGSSPRNFVHPTAPLSADASRARPEYHKTFRSVASEESLGDRLSTPYATGGGERTYFSSADLYRQSPSEERLGGRSPREQDSSRHRSASPRMKSPRDHRDDTSSDASSEDEDDLAPRHKLRPRGFRARQSKGPTSQQTPPPAPPPPPPPRFDRPPQPGLTVENEFGRVHEFSKPVKRSTWNPETTEGQTQAQRMAAEEISRRTSTGYIPVRKTPQPSPLHGVNGASDATFEPLEKPTSWQRQYGSPTDSFPQRQFEPPVDDRGSTKSTAANGVDDSTDSTSPSKPPDDSYFQSREWQEKFSHSGQNPFTPRNIVRNGSPTKGKPISNMKTPRKTSIPRQPTVPRKVKGVSDADSVPGMSSSTESISSGNAMDIDTTTPPPKAAPAKSPINDDNRDPLDMRDLKNTAPFTPSNNAGLGDLNDLGTSLPFESKASAAPPEDVRAQLPNPPKPPTMPNSSPLQAAEWERFVRQMNSYGTEWGVFYKKMLQHFAGRVHKLGVTMQDGWLGGLLTGTNADGLNNYIRWMDDDLRARQHWEVSIERHTKALKDAEQVRQAAVACSLLSY